MNSTGSKSFEKNRRLSACQKVESYIKNAVYAGQLRPRQRVIEGDIARHLGVSRGPVREALLRLEGEGWIVTTSRRGAFIRDISPAEAVVILRIRGKLEGLCVRYLRESETTPLRATLRECLRKLKAAAAKQDYEQFFHMDMGLHRTIWKFSGQPQLIQTLNAVMNPYIFMTARTYSSGTGLMEQYEDHKAYVEMIFTAPVATVEREVEKYFERLSQRILRHVVPAPASSDRHPWLDGGILDPPLPD
jgi:DNA-binding GntR family transcriptional regulator